MSLDADVFTFHLRRGVRWHDGAPFGAGDARSTLREIISNYQSAGRGAYRYLARIDTPALGPILARHLWAGTKYLASPLNNRPVGTGPL